MLYGRAIETSAGHDRRPPRGRSAARRRQLRRRRGVALLALVVVLGLIAWRAAACGGCGCGAGAEEQVRQAGPVPAPPAPQVTGDGVKVGTFLGNYGRRYYGQGPAPKRLDVLWKVRLGSGWSSGKFDTDPPSKWAGSGWTGQPSVVVDGGRAYLIASSYSYKLRKIDAETGEVLWAYKYDDIIKGSPSVFRNPSPTGPDDRYIVVAGSRRGYPYELDDPRVAPVRAVTFGSGKELWRLPVPQTRCYSRDCDGSGFFYDGSYFVGVESGYFYALDPLRTQDWAEGKKPVIAAQQLLLGDERAKRHGRNLVMESSVSALGENLYIASGAGHVYGLRRSDLEVVWDYFVGSDLDGTPVPTSDGLLLQAVEKEYIKGKGGMLCLDPSRPAAEATVWYFPTGDRKVGDWAGGIVGSASVNDAYNPGGKYPALCAFSAIDGYLYVVSRDVMSEKTVAGPNREKGLKTPVEVARIWNGGAISTPILVGDALVAGGYDQRVHLWSVRYDPAAPGDAGALPSANGDGTYWTVTLEERDQFYAEGAFESTPTLWDGRVYIGCRDGWFYCLGDASSAP
ncbi:MAG: PQQ-binding-like beta-propeller repeat protein [Deltaproteobacteria bacterium]